MRFGAACGRAYIIVTVSPIIFCKYLPKMMQIYYYFSFVIDYFHRQPINPFNCSINVVNLSTHIERTSFNQTNPFLYTINPQASLSTITASY